MPYREKFPPPANTNKQTSDHPTSEQIELWRTWGQRNICVRCAEVDDDHEVIGIDVDQYLKGEKQKNGFSQLQRLETAYGSLPDTWIATARTDGMSGIRFFRVPRGLRFHGQADDDIEVIRKGHRYAMVWPSIHPDGGMYWWFPPGVEPTEENRQAWNGEIPDPRAFPLLPDAWIDYLTNHRTLAGDGKPIDEDSSVDAIYQWADDTFHGDDLTDPCPTMRNKLDKHLAKLKHTATFHVLLTKAHWNLFLLAYEGHRGWNEAVREYERAFVDACFARGDRTLNTLHSEVFRSRIEALRKIKGESDRQVKIGAAPVSRDCAVVGCGAGQNLITDENFESFVVQRIWQQRVFDEAKRRLRAENHVPLSRPTTNLTDFLAQPANPTPMRIDDLMPDGGRVVFSAPYKAGKTTAVGNLIRSIVDGDPFLGTFTVNKPASRLVLIDNELSRDMVRDWLLKQGIKNTDAVADVICLRGEVGSFDILNDDRRGEWAKHLRDIGCDYLIFDCLRPVLDALGLDENHDAGKFLTAFDALLSEAGMNGDATIVHHMGHTAQRSRGDSRIQDWPDAIWKLVRENPDDEFSPRYFSATGRDVEVPQGLLTYNPANRHLTFHREVNRTDARKHRKADAAALAITQILTADKNNGGTGVSQNQLINEVMSATGIGKPAAKTALDLGVSEGALIVYSGLNRSKIYSIVTEMPNFNVER